MSAPGALEAHLRERRAEGRKLLVPYLTGGLPDWTDALRTVVAAGADAVEIGLPFSDPVMDGPVIQAASQRALESGATWRSILADARTLDVDVPLAVMCYYNTIHRAGHRRFANELAAAGISAAIVPDLPLEEAGPWAAAADEAGVETVMLAAPTAPDERLPRVVARTRGFVYSVGLLGVTGTRDELADTAVALAARLKAITDVPVLIGVGVSDAAQAVQATRVADGVVMGSAIVRAWQQGGLGAMDDLVRQVRSALDA